MKKFLTFSVLMAVLLTSQVSTIFASEVSGVAGQIEVTTGSSSSDSEYVVNPATGNIFSDSDSGSNILESSGLIDPNVTTADIGQKLTDKGNDVIDIMKIIGKYFCVGGFIVSCIAMFCGLFGNKKSLASGFIGLILSGIMYAAIVMSDDIVVLIATWAAS